MTNHWEALGWTLIHFLWEGTLIALVYRVLDLAFARRSASVRYALALAALLSMPAVALATLAYEEASLDLVAGHVTGALHTAVTAAQTFEPSLTQSAALAPLRDSHLSGHLMPWLDGLWLAGVILLSLRAVGGWWLIQRMSRRTLDAAPHTLRLRLDVLRRQMGISRFVDLHLSRRIASPVTAGVLRPWILLPITALTSLSPEQIEVVLSHELAHIRRSDYLWNLLQTVVETLFFFHPAVWWISRRVREERELCCDDMAVQSCADPSVYATALLRLEEERKSRWRMAMALDGHQSRAGLRARILRILGESDERSSRVRPLSLAAIAVAALLFVFPVTKVFASFRAVPSVATSVAPVVRKAISPVLRAVRAIPTAAQQPAAKPPAAVPANPPQQTEAEPAQNSEPSSGPHSDYIDQMRAAGYNVDLDKYIAMKVQGITPEYAAEMAKALATQLSADQLIAMKVQDITPGYLSQMRSAGYNVDANKYIAMKVQDVTPEYAAEMAKAIGSQLSADRLIAMKVQDVTPEYMAQMRADGYDASPDKYIAMKVQGITPDYANAMAKLGYGKPTVDELIALKVQGVTPEWAGKLHANGIEVSSFQDLISDRIFQVTPEFIAGMKAAGFAAIPQKELIALRVQGVTPEFAKSVRAEFPDATVDDLVRMRVFHIDDAFIASAKQHGFAPLSIQKLVKLRISGILDDADSAKESQP